MFSNNFSSYHNSSGNEDDSDDDIPTLRPVEAVRQSVLGQIRTCGTVSWMEWSFISLSIISIISGCAFNIYRMVTLSPTTDEYVFAIVVLVNLIFCIWYLMHGVFQEQPFEILMFVITSLLLSLLITLNYAANENDDISNSGHLKLTRLIVTIILTVPNALMGLKVSWRYWDSGHLVFKTVGADMRLQRMCRTMFFGMSLLVFDAQAFISCIILFIERGINNLTDEDILIISSGTVFTLLWLFIGYIAIRIENMHLVWLFFFMSIIQPIYSVYLVVDGLHEIVENYSTIRTDSIFVAGGALVTAHFSLLAVFIVIASNFGKGLRSAVYGYEEIDPIINSTTQTQSQSQGANYGSTSTSANDGTTVP